MKQHVLKPFDNFSQGVGQSPKNGEDVLLGFVYTKLDRPWVKTEVGTALIYNSISNTLEVKKLEQDEKGLYYKSEAGIVYLNDYKFQYKFEQVIEEIKSGIAQKKKEDDTKQYAVICSLDIFNSLEERLNPDPTKVVKYLTYEDVKIYFVEGLQQEMRVVLEEQISSER